MLRRASGNSDHLGGAEIRQLCTRVTNENVLGLEISMHHAQAVEMAQPVRHVQCEMHDAAETESLSHTRESDEVVEAVRKALRHDPLRQAVLVAHA